MSLHSNRFQWLSDIANFVYWCIEKPIKHDNIYFNDNLHMIISEIKRASFDASCVKSKYTLQV